MTLSGTPTTTPVTVNVSTADFSGTTAGVDYQAFTNQLVTFAPGETSQTVTVQVRQDDQQESDEHFQVQLSNATNATIINNPFFGVSIGTILDDDVHTLRISEGVTHAEGTSVDGFTAYDFTVSLSGTPTTTPVTVLASTADFSGTTAGVDYQAFTNQLVTFAPGETSQTVTVQVRQDDQQESDEYFQVQLSNATNATIINNPFFGVSIGTILDDDQAPAQPVVRISEGVTHVEGTSVDGFTPYVFTVNLSGRDNDLRRDRGGDDVRRFGDDGGGGLPGTHQSTGDLCAGGDEQDGDGAGAAGRPAGVRRVFPGAAEQRDKRDDYKQPHLRRSASARSPTTTCIPSGSARG